MQTSPFHILAVDDDENIRRVLAVTFRGRDFLLHTAANGQEALEKCGEQQFQVAIIDISMPGMDGKTLMVKIREQYPDTTIIVITGDGRVETVVDMMKAGAYDYLPKPFSVEVLYRKVRRICELAALKSENHHLKSQLRRQHQYRNLVGSSPPMQKIREMISCLSQSQSTVLIQGESGTGKEEIARAIHFSGAQITGPFVPVDCGAISPSIMESELFGHVKGAFTGAQSTFLGLLRAAGNGTIFFDEVGEIPLGVQAKLLRSLQEKEVRPVGGTEVFPILARVIAATNQDLAKAVNDGTFREDLFYRLNVVLIRVPPLRERLEEIPALVEHLLGRLSGKIKAVSADALKVMADYQWPGNIRELDNALQYAAAMGTGDVLLPENLPDRVRSASLGRRGGDYIGDGSLKAYEKRAIIDALDRTNGNRRAAARVLRINEATLYRKLKRLGIS